MHRRGTGEWRKLLPFFILPTLTIPRKIQFDSARVAHRTIKYLYKQPTNWRTLMESILELGLILLVVVVLFGAHAVCDKIDEWKDNR